MNNFYKSHIGIDVAPAIAELAAHPKAWEQITIRQDYAASAHKDTEAILLRWCPGESVTEVFEQLESIPYPAAVLFPNIMDLVRRCATSVAAKRAGRVMLARLKVGGQITRHADEGSYAKAFQRFHLPILSEEGNVFYSETASGAGEWVHMRPGELWEFDNKAPHWVSNGSLAPRVHLIMDFQL